MTLDKRPFRANFRRVFAHDLTVMDIAEPLVSFDADASSEAVRQILERDRFCVAGVRKDGRVAGYVKTADLMSGTLGDRMQAFDTNDVISDQTKLVALVPVLTGKRTAFVRILGLVGAIVTPSDLQKPAVRMWLFGAVTSVEILMSRIIQYEHPDNTWTEQLSPGRVAKAEEVLLERRKSEPSIQLVDCLQFGDKALLSSRSEDFRSRFEIPSRREAKTRLHEMEKLRNILAHGQVIGEAYWSVIDRLALRVSRSDIYDN